MPGLLLRLVLIYVVLPHPFQAICLLSGTQLSDPVTTLASWPGVSCDHVPANFSPFSSDFWELSTTVTGTPAF